MRGRFMGEDWIEVKVTGFHLVWHAGKRGGWSLRLDVFMLVSRLKFF
jgi:hypothetical protein